MKKLILIFLVFSPYLLRAQVSVSHTDQAITKTKIEGAIVKHDREDTVFLRNLPPRSNTIITDYTNTLSTRNIQLVENKLKAFDRLTTTQIAVVILKSVGKYDIMQYGRRLGNSWGIGQKGKNNGILILVAINDKRTAILTGRGLESIVTDSICHSIVKDDFIPQFKKGNYYAGLDAGTNYLIKYLKANYKANN